MELCYSMCLCCAKGEESEVGGWRGVGETGWAKGGDNTVELVGTP